MKVSPSGLAAIKSHEGLRLKAYPDPGSSNGLPITIGYGSTRKLDGSEWHMADEITESEAEALLRRDLEGAERAVQRLVRVPIGQSQFDALVSFVFNVGEGAFADSTLLRKLNAGDYEGASNEFGRWINNDGKPLEGLRRRRAAEMALFTQPAPIVRKDEMSPFVVAALPALIESIPGLIRSFGKGEVTERNAKAAEAVLDVVKAATGTTTEQAAVEAIRNDPVARAAATEALARENWFEPTEAGGGGIEGARKFSIESMGPFWQMPSFWISLLLIVPLYAVVFAVLFTDGWADTIRVQVVTAILAIIGIVGAFWLGSSFGSQKKDAQRA